MVLFSFSINSHIDLIKTARKCQTTRIPRKPRSNGKPAYSVGDKVQLYYRSRMKESCDNCITVPQPCPCNFWHDEISECCHHTNFFGESEIIDIIHYHHGDYKEQHHEIWTGYPLALAGKEDKEAWAIADGFPKGYIQAHDWFYAQTGNHEWAYQNLDVIVWRKEDIIKRWQN